MYTSRIMLVCVAFILALSSKAQSVPKLKFIQPHLVSGINGQKNSIYKFSNVVAGVDAYIQIENIFGGAVLVNIDDSTLGYYDAWQPTVGGPDTLGSYSYIKWSIEFKTTAGATYSFPNFDASSIDVDGDNVRVREFVGINGQSSYDIPSQVPTLLQISNVSSPDNANGDDPNPIDVRALGPVANRIGIDTFSLDVRINYHFTNTSKIKLYTGSQIDDNGNTGAIATDRYHCIYFHNVKSNLFSVLPAKVVIFNAKEKNNKVLLNWSVASDISYDHFEIERSYDQKEFKKFAEVTTSQTTSISLKEYTYSDILPGLNTYNNIYYRLRLIDKRGAFFYSEIKIVQLPGLNNAIIRIAPNPYMEKLSVNLTSEGDDKAEVRISNINGNIIAYQHSTLTRGGNIIELKDLGSKAPGMYVVTVSVNGQMVSSQKVFKK